MADHEQAVRDAAVTLKTAIEQAQAAGYRVDLPAQPRDLDKIAISETAKTPKAEDLTRAPVATLKRPIAGDSGQ